MSAPLPRQPLRRPLPRTAARVACALVASLVVGGSFLAAPHAVADTVTLWDETVIENATVIKIEDGYIYLETPEKKVRAKLANIKSVVKPAVEKVTQLYFDKRTVDNREGYVLGLGITDPRPRLLEPLVRVFVMITDDKGQRDVRLYSSRRGQDPTSLADASMIDTASYEGRYWFIPVTKPVAWHIDAWIDGKQVYAFDNTAEGVSGVQDGWWQTIPMRRASSLIDTPRPRAAPKAADEVVAAEEAAEALPKVVASITNAIVRNGVNDRGVTFACSYTLDSRHLDKAPLPKVTLYYVSESLDGKRSVQKADIETKAGSEEILQTFRLKRDLTYELPAPVTRGLGAGMAINTATETNATKLGEELVYWRLEIVYGETVVAVKEGGTKRAQDSLPPNWWK